MIKISNSILEYIDPYIIIYPTLSNIISRSLVLVNPEWGSKLPFIHLWPEMTGNKVPVACFSGMASLIQLRDWLAVSDPHYLEENSNVLPGYKQNKDVLSWLNYLHLVAVSAILWISGRTVLFFTKDHEMGVLVSGDQR